MSMFIVVSPFPGFRRVRFGQMTSSILLPLYHMMTAKSRELSGKLGSMLVIFSIETKSQRGNVIIEAKMASTLN